MTVEEQIMHRFIYRGSSKESAKEDARAILSLFKSMIEAERLKAVHENIQVLIFTLQNALDVLQNQFVMTFSRH